MEQVIYADILFFVNFSMDFIVLFAVGRLAGRRMRTWPMLLSATIGGVYGVCAVVLYGNAFLGAVIDICVSVIAVLVAFPVSSKGQFFRLFTYFYLFAFLLGGAMNVLYRAFIRLGSALPSLGTSPAVSRFLLLAFSATLLLCIGLGALRRSRYRTGKQITVCLFGKEERIKCFCDSGNLVCDPISGYGVIFIRKGALGSIVTDGLGGFIDSASGDAAGLSCLEPREQRRVRVIPITGVAGEGIACGFMPDYIKVDGVEKHCVIAYGKNIFPAGDLEFDGICPQQILY